MSAAITVSHYPLTKKQKLPPFVKKKRLLVIAGPTATGKSALSLLIAKAVGGEIISADSMQVYEGMNIGTAKPSSKEMQEVSHHLINIREVQEPYNVAEFYADATNAIFEIFAKEHVPMVVGGTGFYLHALLYGPPSGPPSQPELRLRLEEELTSHGVHTLYSRLQKLDPLYALTLSPRDRHKIVRALEIIEITKQPVSDLMPKVKEGHENYEFRCWFLHLPRALLYQRIDERCDKMIALGLINEIEELEKKGIRKNSSASQAIGYKQGLCYLASKRTKADYEEFVRTFKQASRNYAKRQFTWFRKEPLFRQLNIEDLTQDQVAELILQDFESSQ